MRKNERGKRKDGEKMNESWEKKIKEKNMRK